MSAHPDSRFSPILDSKGFSSSADLHLEGGVLRAQFSEGRDTHTVEYKLELPTQGAGVRGRLCLRQWEHIRYVAIGYMDGKTYRHIKAPNIRCEGWVELGFAHQDLIWQIQNAGLPQDDVEIRTLRIFVKGTPSAGGAFLDVAGIEVVPAVDSALPVDQQAPSGQLLEAIYGYLKNNFRNYHEDAQTLLQTNRCPMPGGAQLEWPLGDPKPKGLEDVSTYRFAWHAQHPVISLLLFAHETQQRGAILSCRTLVEEWLRSSYDSPDVDTKFTWYDHGTAERLLAFILLWSVSNQWGGDQRFQARLGQAIVKHARLLASEAFYAYHQPIRYHNHAWFQDAALLAAALAFPQIEEASGWRDLAVSRFEDQLDHLIVRDKGFAIFVENSIGYHHGVQKLALWVGTLVGMSGVISEVPSIAQQLVAWSDFFRYPDGRAPAQGDTFRPAPDFLGPAKPGKPWAEPTCQVLSEAGYCVVKGNDNGKPFMLCLLATSLSKTHKHEDNLSITLWYDGVEWLVDPSFYSHEHQHPIAAYLRSASAHSNVYLPGVEYSKSLGITTLSGRPAEAGFECHGTHMAYEDVDVVRSIGGALDRLDFKVIDQLQARSSVGQAAAAGAHLSFHLAEGVEVVALLNGYRLNHPASTSSLLLEVDPTHGTVLQGLDSNGAPLSVAGQGFLKQVSTTSIDIGLNNAGVIEWRVATFDNNKHDVARTHE